MRTPDEDRRAVWDALQVFWMDADPSDFIDNAAEICARSKYSLDELEEIYWDEVRPALRANLRSIAGEWRGFNIESLTEMILAKPSAPPRWLDRESARWWQKLRARIAAARLLE
jgi:hypothetical protein